MNQAAAQNVQESQEAKAQEITYSTSPNLVKFMTEAKISIAMSSY